MLLVTSDSLLYCSRFARDYGKERKWRVIPLERRWEGPEATGRPRAEENVMRASSLCWNLVFLYFSLGFVMFVWKLNIYLLFFFSDSLAYFLNWLPLNMFSSLLSTSLLLPFGMLVVCWDWMISVWYLECYVYVGNPMMRNSEGFELPNFRVSLACLMLGTGLTWFTGTMCLM